MTLAALLAERQQDKARIERLETALEQIAAARSVTNTLEAPLTIEQLAGFARAVLAGEKDTTPRDPGPRGLDDLGSGADAGYQKEGIREGRVFQPPYRFEASIHGPATIYDAVDVGWIARVKESLPFKDELAAAMVEGLNAAAAGEGDATPPEGDATP